MTIEFGPIKKSRETALAAPNTAREILFTALAAIALPFLAVLAAKRNPEIYRAIIDRTAPRVRGPESPGQPFKH